MAPVPLRVGAGCIEGPVVDPMHHEPFAVQLELRAVLGELNPRVTLGGRGVYAHPLGDDVHRAPPQRQRGANRVEARCERWRRAAIHGRSLHGGDWIHIDGPVHDPHTQFILHHEAHRHARHSGVAASDLRAERHRRLIVEDRPLARPGASEGSAFEQCPCRRSDQGGGLLRGWHTDCAPAGACALALGLMPDIR